MTQPELKTASKITETPWGEGKAMRRGKPDKKKKTTIKQFKIYQYINIYINILILVVASTAAEGIILRYDRCTRIVTQHRLVTLLSIVSTTNSFKLEDTRAFFGSRQPAVSRDDAFWLSGLVCSALNALPRSTSLQDHASHPYRHQYTEDASRNQFRRPENCQLESQTV